jgi:nucleoside 2-deoxyribosyltransferase
MKKSPVCFVAMAFGWDDTDAFYEKQILPTLKRNGIKPVIINRHQSNDDLNFQIFEQLDKADFCIADLTYTRPSVYFEAGYAQRAIPVIYTARKDHLGKGQPDDLRVHFDLQMKPIVVWSSPADLTFSNRLEKRLRATVLKDWRQRQEENEKYEIAKQQFRQLSQFEKLHRIRRLTLYEMRKAGIKLSQWDKVKFEFTSDTSSHGGAYGRKSIIDGHIDHVFASTKIGNKILEISLQTYNSLSKQDLWDLQGAYYAGVFHNGLAERYKTAHLFSHNIALSLRPVTSHQIESVLSSFSPLINSERYVKRYTEKNFKYSESPPRKIINTLHFLSGIESEFDLKNRLKDLIDGYILEQLKQKA